MIDILSSLNDLLYIFLRFWARRVNLKRFPTFSLSSRQVGKKEKQEEGELDLRSDQGRQDAPCHFKWRQDRYFRQRQHCHLILSVDKHSPLTNLIRAWPLSNNSAFIWKFWLTATMIDFKKGASCTDCLNLMKAMHNMINWHFVLQNCTVSCSLRENWECTRVYLHFQWTFSSIRAWNN